MSDSERLLDLIEEGIVEHGSDYGGWTLRQEEALKLFDGRITLRAETFELEPPDEQRVHGHVFATLHDYDDEVLDACVLGLGNGREEALREAASNWIHCVAGPIRSLLDGMASGDAVQAGDSSDDEPDMDAVDFGLPGVRAFVGPFLARFFDDEKIIHASHEMPWFKFATQSAAPRRIHIAKVIVQSHGAAGWNRQLEIDGHEIIVKDREWPLGMPGPEIGYMTRFAVWEFDDKALAQRDEVDRAITYFAKHLTKSSSVDALKEEMVAAGFDIDLVHDTEMLAPLAMGRMLMDGNGIPFPSVAIYARRDGRVDTDVPLMSFPVFSRGKALFRSLLQSIGKDDFLQFCMVSAEMRALTQYLESLGDREPDYKGLSLAPPIISDRLAPSETVDEAMSLLNQMLSELVAKAKKPWWKFW